MNKVIIARDNGQEPADEMLRALEQYPVTMHADIREAYRAADDGDYEKAEELCRRLLDYKADPEIRMLLGVCYFVRGNMQDARMVFSDLTAEYPEEEECLRYLGMTDHALGRFEDAVRELGSMYPPETYRPFYYTAYGDSLQQLGRLRQSRDAFYEEAAYFEETGEIYSPDMLDGAFQNLLYLDIVLGNGKYPQDVRLYFDFLDQTEMTEKMQDYLAENIVYFCSLMHNKGYRPLFLEFITRIREKGYLTEEWRLETLASAFSYWESFLFHEDRRVSQLMETYLNASHKRRYLALGEFAEEERDRIMATALCYDWYMCQYAPEHMQELDYVKEAYPHTYGENREFFEKVREDPKGTAEKTMDELFFYVENASLQEFTQSISLTYQEACKYEKEPAFVYDGGETYRRIQPRVGRNDPCPCGSGKKYKKCCGR